MGHTKTAKSRGGRRVSVGVHFTTPPTSLSRAGDGAATLGPDELLNPAHACQVWQTKKAALHRGARTHAQQVSWRGETCVARRHAMRASLSFVHVTCVNTVQENDPMLPWRHCIDGGCQAFALICVCIELAALELDHQPHSYTRASTHSEHITLRHSAFLCSVADHRSAPTLHPEV